VRDDDTPFPDEDPFNDPAWQRSLAMAGAPLAPAQGYVTCQLAWLARVAGVVNTPSQLVVALVLYRECLIRRSPAVALSNGAVRKLGLSRYAKYRALAVLEEAGAVKMEALKGRSIRVTLRWFP
jgi:hypothetical protein